MLSSPPRSGRFMWCRRVLKSVFFDHAEALAYERSFMQPIHDAEEENQIDANDEEGNFTVLKSGKITNPTEEDMAVF